MPCNDIVIPFPSSLLDSKWCGASCILATRLTPGTHTFSLSLLPSCNFLSLHPLSTISLPLSPDHPISFSFTYLINCYSLVCDPLTRLHGFFRRRCQDWRRSANDRGTEKGGGFAQGIQRFRDVEIDRLSRQSRFYRLLYHYLSLVAHECIRGWSSQLV